LFYEYDLDEIFGIWLLDDYDPKLSIEVIEGKVNIIILIRSLFNLALIEAL
jgi:hypothetical protein